jgi:hypothetical protein
MQNGAKDWWDKVDVLVKPVGGLLTALAVAYVGMLGSNYLKTKEAQEADTQLYAELLSKKQERDTAFRRDILKPAIDAVMAPGAPIETRMLNMELLAANFQESLDLGPLFKHMAGQLYASTTSHKEDYVRRMERDADEIKSRQLVALRGQVFEGTLDLDNLRAHPEGVRIMDWDARLHSEDLNDLQKRQFAVEVLQVNPVGKEVFVRLLVMTPNTADKHLSNDFDDRLDVAFWVGLFDFPMNDNFSLSHNQRCAIVLRRLTPDTASMMLAYFPESSEDPVQVLKRKLADAK